MAVPDVKTNLQNTHAMGYVSGIGASTGKKGVLISPVRGRIVEVGFSLDSACNSAMTFQVDVFDNTDNTASTSVNIVTSTLGTFASTVTLEGSICSVVPPANAYVNPGNVIRCTASGGFSLAINGSIYAIIRRG